MDSSLPVNPARAGRLIAGGIDSSILCCGINPEKMGRRSNHEKRYHAFCAIGSADHTGVVFPAKDDTRHLCTRRIRHDNEQDVQGGLKWAF